MSKYTTEVRFICEQKAGYDESAGSNKVNDILDRSWDKIFDFDFPIFDENYRKPLCKKILRHFYTREICEETVGLWKLRLEDKMNMLMPYYNKLYDSELLSISPLVNYRVNTTRKDTKTGGDSVNQTINESENTSGGGSVIRTGGYTDTHTGDSELQKLGSRSNTKTGNKTLVKSGTETDTRSGNETKTKGGKYSEIDTQTGSAIKEIKGNNGTTTEDYVDLFTDTPQGNIANMGSGYTGGSGVPIVGSDTSYLTTAEKTSKSITDGRNISETNKVSDGFEKRKTTDYTGETPYTETDTYNQVADTKSFVDRTDTESYNNIVDTEAFTDRKDKTVNNLTDQRVFNSQTDTTTESKTKQDAKTDTKNITYGSVNDWLESVVGSKGKSDSELLNEFRSTFLNIDAMLIENLEDLFILLW